MPRTGRRHALLIYTRMVDRWWGKTLSLSIVVGVLAWLVSIKPAGQLQPWRWQTLAIAASGAFLLTLLLLIARNTAVVRTFPNFLRIGTPFLQINISYKRIRRTSTSQMGILFPPKKISGWRRDFISPLAAKTAVIIDLSSYPISETILRLFLSSFFFKDKTPHLVLLVNDWLQLSTELESCRHGGGDTPSGQRPMSNSILSRLPKDQG
ncbi:MAG: hypothetical protein JXA13_12090 [Anaerolineales bacterium]|nr:hypothetical protein [Anaerolineales bacterium]